ncbi:GAF and ANTAR domain-containing protein [Nocardioides sp. W7]|uniref:GAF and ANTAR domain-containing protein n=1 Tax=Nocardioides sp. W7 TaxID=2931390 RepID=UPI001FCFB454|nr:GAF and ANTAR domain-containing protein [Nocardioides sp. W7]
MTMVPAERLAEVLVEVADTLVDEFDLIEFLKKVAEHTTEIAQAQGAGILLADHHGRLQLMAASDERARTLELFQLQADEGPCQDCFRLGKPVIDADLAAARHLWPHFAPRAVAAGFRSVHAFPLRLRQTVIGALNLFGTEIGHMTPADVRVVQALADIATIGILQERAIHRGEVLTEQLQVALNSRIVVEQAKGVLAQLHGISVDDAFDMLRGYARTHQQLLGKVARAITEDPTSLPDLTTPRPA